MLARTAQVSCHAEALVLFRRLQSLLRLSDMDGAHLLQVLYTPDLWVPLVRLHGVYILPGIPRLFKAMIEANKEPFKGPQSRVRVLYTNTVEGDLAGIPMCILSVCGPYVWCGDG